MGLTLTRQDTEIRQSDLFDDTLAAGATLESGSTNIESDLNSIRSQVKRILDDSAGNWYDDLATVNSKKRDLKDLNTDLDDMEEKKLLCGVQVLTDISVPAAQNYVVLSVAGSEAPTNVAAVTAAQTGAVVAVLGTDVGVHSLAEVAGSNALTPKNLLMIRDASTKESLLSNNQQVYGLLQAETGVVDGDTFDDTTKQVQISFVRNNGSDDLEAVPVADIQSKTIEYIYSNRITLDTLPEDCGFPYINFTDQIASQDVTLDNAIDNQGATPATQGTDIFVRIDDTFEWTFQDSAGTADIFSVKAEAAGDEVEFNVTTFDVNNSATADFSQGISVDSTDQAINIGNTTGQIDTTGSLVINASGGSSDLTLDAGLEMKFVDGNKSGSTFAGDLKLAETSAEWDAYETAFGEVSLLNAIVQASSASATQKVSYVVTATINPDNDLDPGVNATVINGSTYDLTSISFTDTLKVYLNGKRLIGGADASANNDFYPGTDLTNGEIKFETRKLKSGDQVIVETG